MVFFKVYIFFQLSLSLHLWISYDVTVEMRGGGVLDLPDSIPFTLLDKYLGNAVVELCSCYNQTLLIDQIPNQTELITRPNCR